MSMMNVWESALLVRPTPVPSWCLHRQIHETLSKIFCNLAQVLQPLGLPRSLQMGRWSSHRRVSDPEWTFHLPYPQMDCPSPQIVAPSFFFLFRHIFSSSPIASRGRIAEESLELAKPKASILILQRRKPCPYISKVLGAKTGCCERGNAKAILTLQQSIGFQCLMTSSFFSRTFSLDRGRSRAISALQWGMHFDDQAPNIKP